MTKLRTATEFVDDLTSKSPGVKRFVIPAWIMANFLIERENEGAIGWNADNPEFAWNGVMFHCAGNKDDYYRILDVARAYGKIRHLIEDPKQKVEVRSDPAS